MYEPAELEMRHFTEQDNEIRNMDIPERMQLRNFPVRFVLPFDNYMNLLDFAAFFHVASLFSTQDNKKVGVGVDDEKALELTNSTVFHKGR